MLRADVSCTTYDKVAVISGLRYLEVLYKMFKFRFYYRNLDVNTDTVDNDVPFFFIVKLFVPLTFSANFLIFMHLPYVLDLLNHSILASG